MNTGKRDKSNFQIRTLRHSGKCHQNTTPLTTSAIGTLRHSLALQLGTSHPRENNTKIQKRLARRFCRRTIEHRTNTPSNTCRTIRRKSLLHTYLVNEQTIRRYTSPPKPLPGRQEFRRSSSFSIPQTARKQSANKQSAPYGLTHSPLVSGRSAVCESTQVISLGIGVTSWRRASWGMGQRGTANTVRGTFHGERGLSTR